MPRLASLPTISIVRSTPFLTMPSPPKNWLPPRYISRPSSPASTAAAILAAQLAFAPSQTMPEVTATVLTIVWAITSKRPPCRYAMPEAAPAPALTAPQ